MIHSVEGPCGCAACLAAAGPGDGGPLSAGTEKPLLSPDAVAANLARAGAVWAERTIGFAFRETAPPAGYGPEVPLFSPFTAEQRATARTVLQLWDDLIPLSLVETAESAASIVLANRTDPVTYHAYAYLPGTGSGGDVWVHIAQPNNSRLLLGQFGRHVQIHEVGHALGLLHPGEYNNANNAPAITYGEHAEYRQDSRQYTVLSYFGANNTGSNHSQAGQELFAGTPLLHDVLAIQRLYGADLGTRTGDSVYGYNANVDRAALDFAQNQRPVVAIWDAGGVDTLDLSGGLAAARIDLRPGAFSDVNGLTNNVAIAFDAWIENAAGTPFADRITGNALPNTLTGGAGNDTIEGGGGVDTARYAGARAGYEVTAGASGTVVRDLSGAEGTDLLTGVERLVFADGTVDLSAASAPPRVTVNGLRVVEGEERAPAGAEYGHTVLFTVALDRPVDHAVTLRYATLAGTARAGEDYMAASGTVTLAPGQSAALIPVRIVQDGAAEGEESFFLVLDGAEGAELPGGELRARALIADDDQAGGPGVVPAGDPPASVATTAVLEPGVVRSAAVETTGDRDWFRMTLEAGVTYTIDLKGSSSGSGTLVDPFLLLLNGAGTLITANDDGGAGSDSRITYTPTTSGTYFAEAKAFDENRTGSYVLSLAVGSQPEAPRHPDLPVLSVTNATVQEGDGGGAALVFTISLSATSAQPVTVHAATEDGTATAGRDYRALSATVTIPAGATGATVSVPLLGDRAAEAAETLTLRLSTPSGAVLADGAATLAATGTLGDDDAGAAPPPGLVLSRAGGDVLVWTPSEGAAGFRHLAGFDASVTVAGAADFSGDGRVDLLLASGARRFVWDASRGAEGFTELPDFGSYRPIAVGAFTGDGAPDLLLRDDATGTLLFHEVAAVRAVPFLTAGPAIAVAGTGDLDGLGVDDVLFRDAGTGQLFYWNGSAFTDLLLLPLDWSVAAIGNFLGDGADDLLLREGGSGRLVFWNALRGPDGFRDFVTPAPGWAVLGTGDVDGDGRDDVVLGEAAGGQAVFWNGSGFGDLGGVLAGVALAGVGTA